MFQIREGDRQKERVGELDVDASEHMRDKDEQLKRQEKWIENYKLKVEVSICILLFSLVY